MITGKVITKTGVIFTSILVFALLLSGCSEQVAEVTPEKVKLVQVQAAKEESYPVQLRYTGLTSAGDVQKYSFKVSGKLIDLAVEKDSPVKSGQKLAALDTTEYSLAVQASQLNVTKAEKAYKEALDTYQKLEQLFEAGALPESDLIKAKLDLDVKEATYNQAKIELEAKQIQLKDAQLYADRDGYVVDVLFQESEIVAAGYPVVVVRSPEQKVNVGLSQNDVQKVKVGTLAEITMDGLKASGKVTRVDAIPDSQTRTYNAEILLTKLFPVDSYHLGATTEVSFEQGEAGGIWVPLACVLNDGEDYVFVVEEDRAVKRNIKLLDVQGFNVRVEGIMPGDSYVISGMKTLKEGNKVKVQSEVNLNEQ